MGWDGLLRTEQNGTEQERNGMEWNETEQNRLKK